MDGATVVTAKGVLGCRSAGGTASKWPPFWWCAATQKTAPCGRTPIARSAPMGVSQPASSQRGLRGDRTLRPLGRLQPIPPSAAGYFSPGRWAFTVTRPMRADQPGSGTFSSYLFRLAINWGHVYLDVPSPGCGRQVR